MNFLNLNLRKSYKSVIYALQNVNFGLQYNKEKYCEGVNCLGKFSEYLVEQRRSRRLNLRDAANLIGISHTYLSHLEKGIDPRTNEEFYPSPEILKKIASAYSANYYELMFMCGYVDEIASQEFIEQEKYRIIARNMMECQKKNPEVFKEIMEALFEGNDADRN